MKEARALVLGRQPHAGCAGQGCRARAAEIARTRADLHGLEAPEPSVALRKVSVDRAADVELRGMMASTCIHLEILPQGHTVSAVRALFKLVQQSEGGSHLPIAYSLDPGDTMGLVLWKFK